MSIVIIFTAYVSLNNDYDNDDDGDDDNDAFVICIKILILMVPCLLCHGKPSVPFETLRE